MTCVTSPTATASIWVRGDAVWIRRADVNGDGTLDTVLYDNAGGGGGIYAVLNAVDDLLDADDFPQAGTIVTEIV